jgi:O-antigen/teichoic acid export membrane protein
VTSRLGATRDLAVANAIAAAFTFGAGVYQARVLGAEQLGVMAVIAGITVSVFTLVDVRLGDVAARAFYEVDGLSEAQAAAHRAGVVWLATLAALAQGAVAAALLTAGGNALVPLFTGAPVAWWWLPADAAGLACATATGGVFYVLRFSREYRAIGTWRVATQAGHLAITVAVLTAAPTLGGAFGAGVASGALGLATALAVSWRLWTRRAGLPLARPDWRRALGAYRRSLPMLLYGGLLSYAKLLHRGVDVLALAYVAGDRETGLYRLARQVVDGGVAVVQDALYQVYFPDFLEHLARGALRAYRALARRLAAACAAVTVAGMAGGAVVLPALVPLVFGPDFAGAERPMLILAVTFFFIAGCHPWLWAPFVRAGHLGAYTAVAFLGVLAQYAVLLALVRLSGPTAGAGAAALLAYYVVTIPAVYALGVRRFPAWLPGPGAAAAAGAGAASPP